MAVEVFGWRQVASRPSPQTRPHKGKHRPRQRRSEAQNTASEAPEETWLHPDGRYWLEPCAYSQHFQSALALLTRFAPAEFAVAYGRDYDGVCWARIRRRDDTRDTGIIAGACLAHALSLAALEAVHWHKTALDQRSVCLRNVFWNGRGLHQRF